MKWISEAEELPKVGETVLFMVPRQADNIWDISTAVLLVTHEDVRPRPIKPGARWPVDYSWCRGRGRSDVCLVTGNGWWARLDDIPLPPGAAHRTDHPGGHYIEQIGNPFIPQGK